MTTGDATASFIVVNPTDWETLLTLADTTDQYFGLGPFGAGTPPRVWNLDVVLSEDKAGGQRARWRWHGGAGDRPHGGADSGVRSALRFAIRNILVLLAEERIGLAVFRAAAFGLVDLV